ncbi:MAG: hypothetical protein JWM83_1534 [Candidatus Angelobacter sp.]|nr:hypothetical protein [Candidatus Angelobacter sp.]
MGDRVSATVEFGEKRITIEGPAEFVERELAKFRSPTSGNDSAASSELVSNGQNGIADFRSEREFVAHKRPTGHHEIVAVLAFWLTNTGKAVFSADDIRKGYLRAQVRPPKVVDQALRDAKNKFDYIDAGPERGTYKLTSHGDTVVRFDLPREERKKESA